MTQEGIAVRNAKEVSMDEPVIQSVLAIINAPVGDRRRQVAEISLCAVNSKRRIVGFVTCNPDRPERCVSDALVNAPEWRALEQLAVDSRLLKKRGSKVLASRRPDAAHIDLLDFMLLQRGFDAPYPHPQRE